MSEYKCHACGYEYSADKPGCPDCQRAKLIGCDAWLGDFKPSLRNTSGNTWEACITLPVVGQVTTQGNGWPEAKMRLWLVSRAVGILAARTRELQEPKDWTEAEWRSTLKTMGDVWSPNDQS
jgi:hypothetical protein